MSLQIPTIPDELEALVRALVWSAWLLRRVFVQAGEGWPMDDILADHGNTLELADRVLDRWAAHVGVNADEPDRRRRARAR